MSRPLRSTATPASSGFTATTGRSASERRDRYSMSPVSAVGTLPPANPWRPTTPGRDVDARLLTFRARAADQAHAASTPDTTWPGTRAPARPIPRGYQGPPVSMPSNAFRRLNSAHPPNESGRVLLERLPGPHLTGSSPAFSLDARHDSLQLTQLQGSLTPTPAGPTPEGQQASISRTAPPMNDVSYTDTSFSVRDALIAALEQLARDRQARVGCRRSAPWPRGSTRDRGCAHPGVRPARPHTAPSAAPEVLGGRCARASGADRTDAP